MKILLVLLALIIGFHVWGFFQPSVSIEKFESSQWVTALVENTSLDPGCFRGGMALDIIERNLVTRKSKNEVILVLGDPSSQNQNIWRYYLGQCSGFGWHDSELIVSFDQSDTVNNVSFQRVPLP